MAVSIIMLGLLALVGFVVGKTGYLPGNPGVVLSQVVIKLTAPIYILTTLASKSFTGKEIRDGAWIYVFGLVFMIISFSITLAVSGKLKMKESTRNVFLMHSMFGNVAFLAFPLIESVYGRTWLVFAVFFNIANDTLLWTLGIYLVNKHKATNWKSNLKHLINGNTIAFTLGIFCILIDLQGIVNNSHLAKSIYDMLYKTFNRLGETTIPLSMVFIGLILSEIRISSIKDLLKRYPSFILSFIKLVFIPMIALVALNALGGNHISPMVKGIVVLQLAMPCGTIVPAIAAQYDSDYKFATENVFISTILCVFTLPFMAWLVS